LSDFPFASDAELQVFSYRAACRFVRRAYPRTSTIDARFLHARRLVYPFAKETLLDRVVGVVALDIIRHAFSTLAIDANAAGAVLRLPYPVNAFLGNFVGA
jgi:hypothetical protein